MSGKKMNILLTLNNGYAKYACVMLTSLFLNNATEKFFIYCLYNTLDDDHQEMLRNTVEKYSHQIVFAKVDASVYRDFPTPGHLTIECYLILLAHLYLPQDMERILYLDADMVVEGSVRPLYDMDFEGQFLVACGQSFEQIDGHYYLRGARAVRGELFNSGVMLFNLPKFRKEVTKELYLETAKREKYNFWEDQGILNVVFADSTKIIDTSEYNFRLGILEQYLQIDVKQVELHPRILHYTMRDYYRIGFYGKPWDLTFNRRECRVLQKAGIMPKPYIQKQSVEAAEWMMRRWWHYAKKTAFYPEFKTAMEKKKKEVMGWWMYQGSLLSSGLVIKKESERRRDFSQITAGRPGQIDLSKYTYGELEQYIDQLDADSAIKTMQNLFRYNCAAMKKKPVLRVAFVVYSSAEWQCEEVYRLMEQSERFDPWIVIAGYKHGITETVRRRYVSTCTYFRESGRSYQIEYLGYMDRPIRSCDLDSFDLLFYITPWPMTPFSIDITARRLMQMSIYIPYGPHMTDPQEAHYANPYCARFEKPVFKLCWSYFSSCSGEMELVAENQRLKGYNIIPAGVPKLDPLLSKSYLPRKDLWKNEGKIDHKIIWAPHWNIGPGMNSTFHINYEWFYEFARLHPAISWVVRPHPRLDVGALEAGVFSSYEEYIAYFDQWNRLPNASVIPYGEYIDIFDTSDAMITDCISFLLEYALSGHPMLQLIPTKPRVLSGWTQKIIEHQYTCGGDDFMAVENFIMTIIDRDPKKESRDRIVEEKLNWFLRNGKSASQFICDTILDKCT